MKEIEIKALYWIDSHGGEATRTMLHRHMHFFGKQQRLDTLNSMSKRGFLTKTAKINPRGPKTIGYRLTDKGKAKLTQLQEEGRV